jgi:transcriptional regulator with XRE-family HTH domain
MAHKRPVDGRVGARLAAARQARGMSQGWLAKRIGVSVGLVQAYEHGRTRIAVERLMELAEVLHCDAANLLPPPPRHPAAWLHDADRPAMTTICKPAHVRSCRRKAQDARETGRAAPAPHRRA